MTHTLKVGTLAYFNGFNGLTACKVVSLRKDERNGSIWADIQITGKSNLAPIGHISCGWSIRRLVPRDCIRRRKYGTRIVGGFTSIEA